MKYLIHVLILLALSSSAAPTLLYAATGSGLANGSRGSGLGSCEGICLENPLGEDSSLIGFFEAIIDIVLVFAVPIIVFFIILAGFKYVTARGDTGAIQQAHMALLYALIGGVLILGAKVLIEVISGTVNSIKG